MAGFGKFGRLVILLSSCAAVALAGSDRNPPAATGADAKAKVGLNREQTAQARQRAIEYLRASQADDGHWSDYPGPAITGIVATALLRSGVPAEDPLVARALDYIKGYLQPDGGIYNKENKVSNYETSVALLAFHAANADGRHDKLITSTRKFLQKLQWDEDEGVKPDDFKYGGAGYGSSQRPDLSNTSFLLDALVAAGIDQDDDTMKKVLIFVSRCQNLESEHNTTPFASKVNDGGFYYTPAAGGTSQAGNADGGGLRSYGSMTYAGLKSMIYAGVTAEDHRVKAAYQWIRKHYTVEENPQMGQQGLYYYYHTFAKALDALGLPEVEDAAGVRHDWRAELGRHLLSLQKVNGSWVNAEKRWQEGDPNLATAFALLALDLCHAPKPKPAP